MKEGVGQPGPAQPPRKVGKSDFRKAFIWIAIPLVALAILDLALGWLSSYLWRSDVPGRFFSLGFPLTILWVAALFTAIGFAIAGKRQIAAGMFAGVGVGLVALGLTCFGFLIPM